MIKAILFDYDGVLTIDDNSNLIWDELNPILKIPANNIKNTLLKYDNLYLTGKITNKEFWDLISKDLDIKPNYKLFNSLFMKKTKLNLELIKIISKLKLKYKLGIISNNFIEIEKEVKKEIGSLFEILVFSGKIGYTKKDKEPFLYTLKKLNLKPEECVFIDNSLSNLEQPKEIGINIIQYDSTKNSLKFLIKELEKLNIEI